LLTSMVFTVCNANGSHGVTGVAMTGITTGVMYVVDLATNRSDVYAARWSRRTLRSVIDWSLIITTGRSDGVWATGRDSGVSACD
jgi:hypothetical protein